ncbi:hypothetical protein [Yersinia sp. Marseille-Q3913]|uniref:hypothetical protein n=1 Tax=Yersinia sp. Marseille-Q3913 TaxID=2830769 RepID=UPI001BAF0F93|nr:hypothetical protein [Yersinia sp. Marseille-Q3913]MBS0056598.1 hypothetical protein [Yersinia sp. Marseille-Q3913]
MPKYDEQNSKTDKKKPGSHPYRSGKPEARPHEEYADPSHHYLSGLPGESDKFLGNPKRFATDHSIKELARGALEYSRRCYPLKSPNKIYLDKEAPNVVDNYSRSGLIDLCRDVALRDLRVAQEKCGLNSGQLADYAHNQNKIGNGNEFAGNCDELAASAFRFIITEGHSILDNEKRLEVLQVGLINPNPFGHTWVIVRYIKPDGGESYDTSYGIVCDPWANIICDTAEFSYIWGQKMSKWSTAGKYISVPTGYLSPTDPGVLNFLNKGVRMLQYQLMLAQVSRI